MLELNWKHSYYPCFRDSYKVVLFVCFFFSAYNPICSSMLSPAFCPVSDSDKHDVTEWNMYNQMGFIQSKWFCKQFELIVQGSLWFVPVCESLRSKPSNTRIRTVCLKCLFLLLCINMILYSGSLCITVFARIEPFHAVGSLFFWSCTVRLTGNPYFQTEKKR